jgi:DNA-binding response OmpR family regulator
MRLLLVEDDARIAEFLRRGLQAEGYQLDIAGDGACALILGASGNYTLVILDLMLPGMDGREVCRRLRAQNIATPILMLTALDAVEDKVEGLRLGADDYLTKPFAFAELLARLQALLRRRGSYQSHTAMLRVGPLILNRVTHEVTRDGRSIKLTPKEFALLECLMNQPDMVLSRTRILELVWGAEDDPLTNVVEVYIRHLRNKIDDGQHRSLIQNVRGFGYKLTTAPSAQT